MALSSFLRDILESSHVAVATDDELTRDDLRAADEVLGEADRLWRLEAPGTPPALALPAARWAAIVLFRACQAIVDRDLGMDRFAADTRARPFDVANPAVHSSVDLTFRFLPEVIAVARRIAEADPLVDALRQLAAEWPLSSVGIDGIAATAIAPVLADESLRQLYVDRIIARGAVDRLDSPRLRDDVKRALGAYPDLAPSFAACLEEVPPKEDSAA